MELKINDLYDQRITSLCVAYESHKFICSYLRLAAIVTILVGGSIQGVKLIWNATGTIQSNTMLMLDASITLCAMLYKLVDMDGRVAKHRVAQIGANDIIEYMKFRRGKAQRSQIDMDEELSDISHRIDIYRVTEPPIPLWVKEKFAMQVCLNAKE
jgi:hypothetical protein